MKIIPNKSGLSNADFVNMFKIMWQIRLFEEAIEVLYQAGELHGTNHLCIGQEATAAGANYLLKKDDWITSTHRGHGHSIAKGTPINEMMAEMLGKKAGTNEGKGGSMHIAKMSQGNLGSNGIVGANLPIAAGAALSAQMRGTNQVVVCFTGDGATNEGSFHEALNIASIWHLPVIYFVENNQYGMSSPIQEMMNIEKISLRATSYGIEGVTIDGNDLLSVVDTMAGLIQRARAGEGPFLVEALTYRYKGHSKSDKLLYRTAEEEEAWRTGCDPIKRVTQLLLDYKVLSIDELEAIPDKIQKEIAEIILWAKKMPEPQGKDLTTHVFAEAGETHA